MTPVYGPWSIPTPQPDHGAAGFCTDHGQVPDGRVETVARVAYRALYPGHINTHDSARTPESDAAERDRAYETWDAGREGYAPGRTCRLLAAAVVAALDELPRTALRRLWEERRDAQAETARLRGINAQSVAIAESMARMVRGQSDAREAAETDLAAARAALDRVRAEGWAEGHRVGWEHCQDGNYGNDWHDDDTPNPYCAALDPEEPAPCPTCSWPVRETVGMVCQTCGTDYATEELR